ncbi:MAG: hypothetical protein ACXACY_23760 [Candidatus Hodarchaeales archaeon]
MYNKKNQIRMEKNQERIDAGIMSKHFPDVSSIVISMMYKQKGTANPIHRTVNITSDSYAFFKVNCLTRDCVEGGFDLTQVITSMIRNHKQSVKGDLGCEGNGPRADHSEIKYEVAIQYL